MTTPTEFLSFFPGHLYQTFDDKGQNRKDLIRCGKPSDIPSALLEELNKKGAAICFSINSFPSGVRKAAECTGVNAWFFEVDEASLDEQWCKINNSPLAPSLIVQTKKSLHCYYFALHGTIEHFEKIQRALIAYFDADPACKDITRVFRIPGFYHNKEEPIMVKIVDSKKTLYTEEQMLEAFPHKEENKTAQSDQNKITSSPFWKVASSLDNKMMLQRLSGSKLINSDEISFKPRSGGGEYIFVNGKSSDSWIDENGMIGSGKNGGPTWIQWFEYYGVKKGDIAQWLKDECPELIGDESSKNQELEKLTLTKAVLKAFEKLKPQYFKDEMEEAYVQVEIEEKKHIIKCESSRFEKLLLKVFWEEYGEALSPDSIKKIKNMLAARAEFGPTQFELFNRIAKKENEIWYDLGDQTAIQIGIQGWEHMKDPPVLFRKYQHQKQQLLPYSGGSIRMIFQYVRIDEENNQIMFLVWLVACFVPEIPHPILILHGEKGAAKSTTMRFLLALIDPSKTELLTLPHKQELVQQLSHHYAAFYDNVHKITQAVSDILCRGVTGTGASKRKLYTDSDDKILNFRRIIAMNGINNAAEAPDLLDRSILIELKRIPATERKTERKLRTAFKKDIPTILGSIFDVLPKAMKIHADLELTDFPRMADFAEWGYAIAEALGIGGKAFMEAYKSNIKQQNNEVIENDSLALCLIKYVENNNDNRQKPTELLNSLKEIAQDLKINEKELPKNASALGRELTVIKSNLEEYGISFDKIRESNSRFYVFRRISKPAVTPVTDVIDASASINTNDSNDTNDSSPGKTVGEATDEELNTWPSDDSINNS